MKYPEMFPDQPGNRLGRVTRTMFAGSVGRRQAETILERIAESSALMPACEIRVLGGAMARVPANATAFAHRQSRVMINVQAIYDPSNSERSDHIAWSRALAAELYDGDPGAYAGFLADEGEERVHAAYPRATWERLAAVKAIFDPDNVFRLNQNIPPGHDHSRAAQPVQRLPCTARSSAAQDSPKTRRCAALVIKPYSESSTT
jgi:FAD/FMN-containing dehydrogenase